MATAANDQRNKALTVTDVGTADDGILRANFYGLLARALARPLDDDALEVMRTLSDHQDDTPLGNALNAFGKLAQRTPRARAEEEFSTLFYGFGAGGELSPYASYYLTGLVYDKPLAELRTDMAQLGIAPADGNGEPEDHIASLCEMMHGILTGAFGDPRSAKSFFDKHLAPWAGKFFADLEKAPSAVMYMPLGTIGRLFIEVEREAFDMAA